MLINCFQVSLLFVFILKVTQVQCTEIRNRREATEPSNIDIFLSQINDKMIQFKTELKLLKDENLSFNSKELESKFEILRLELDVKFNETIDNEKKFSKRINVLENQVQKLLNHVDTLDSNIAFLKEQQKQVDEKLEKVNATNFEMKEDVFSMEDELNSTDKWIEGKLRDLPNTESEMGRLENDLKKIERKAENFEINEEALQKKLQKLDSKVKVNEINISSIENILHLRGIQANYTNIFDDDWYELMEYNWIIQNTNDWFNSDKYEMTSKEFQLKGYSCSAVLKLEMSKGIVRFFLSLTYNGRTWYFLKAPVITFILRNRASEEKPIQVLRTAFLLPGKTSLLNANPKEDLQQMFHVREFKKSQFYANGNVILEIHVEPPSKATFNDGQLLWRIKNSRKKMAEAGLTYEMSPCFYTNPQGFKAQVIMQFDGEKKQLFMWFNVLRQDSTDYHLTPFDCAVVVTIFNQVDPTENKVFNRRYYKVSDFQFDKFEIASYEEIREMIENGIIYYKVEVKEKNNN